MNKKLLTMVTTGAIALSNMNFAFAEGFMATPEDSEFPMFVDGGFIPGGSVPKGEHPIFKIPNAHIPEIFDDEAVEMGDDIVDDVISGEELEDEPIIDEAEQEEGLEDEPIIDEAEMERLEREEHEKELAEKEQAKEEDDDEIMDEIEKDAEKYDKENEEDTIGGIDDDYYDVGEEPEIKDEDPAENIPDEDDKAESNKEKEEVEKSNNKEVVSNENNSNTNVSNNTAGAIDNSSSQDKEIEKQANEIIANADDTKVDEEKVFKELDDYQKGKGDSSNPKTGDIGIMGSIAGMIVGLGGIILRKKL